MKRVTILGSTGSIGCNVVDVIEQHPDQFTIVGVGARRSVEKIESQCRNHPEARFALIDAASHGELCARNPDLAGRSVGAGETALVDLIGSTSPDLVVNALVGFVGLESTVAALEAGIPVALANKETIVTGGELLLDRARENRAQVIPIDSEHVAISQCLRSEPPEQVRRIVITASGGALRSRPLEDFDTVAIDDVLAHPTWSMGAKITVDSATMMNKGLEIIEAHWLFGLPYDKIDVVIHEQSIVHSLVEFIDGSMLAQMGDPDMRYPILYALSYPARIASKLRSSITGFPELSFSAVDPRRYPCFELAAEAGRAGGTSPTVLNAANETAVAAFLEGRVAFQAIPDIIAAALSKIERREVSSLNDIYETDAATREWIAGAYSLGQTTR